MEHIVQFAINIDDKTIQKRLEDNAYDDVVKRIYKEALDNLEFPRTYGNRINWDSFVSDLVSRLLEEHKMEIVDAAAEKLAKSIRNKQQGIQGTQTGSHGGYGMTYEGAIAIVIVTYVFLMLIAWWGGGR